jgi:mannose-6-phosphate isomerase-like protein (cupin superfamily)
MKYEKITGLKLGISKKDLRLDDVLFTPFFYEQELIKAIVSTDKCVTVRTIVETAGYVDGTIVIDGVEKFSQTLFKLCKVIASGLNHDGPVACQIFLARENSIGFPVCTNSDDVLLYVVEGEKTIRLEKETITLQTGEALFLSRGVVYQAINTKASIMMSFSFEQYSFDKLRL